MTASLEGLCKTQSTKNICNNQIVHAEGSHASKSLINFTARPLFDAICSKIGKQMLPLQADACFHSSLTLPQHLHLILPIQPFYIFITGVGNAKTIRAPSAI